MFKLETLPEKPKHHQFAIFGVAALLIYGLFWYFITSPTRTETAGLNEQIAKYQQDNAKAQIASQRLNEFKQAYSRAQADYEDLKALLPEQRELTSVLGSIQDRARGDRLSLRRFTPKEDFQENFYSGKPIEVEVSGSYNRLGQFFAQMAAYQRIVSITDFDIKQLGEQNAGDTINAQFTLKAYYVSAEKLQTTTNAAPGAPPAATPANPGTTPPTAK